MRVIVLHATAFCHPQGKSLTMQLHMPDWHAMQGSTEALAAATDDKWKAFIPNREELPGCRPRSMAGDGVTSVDGVIAAKEEAWIECLWCPFARLTFEYTSHSAVPYGEDSQFVETHADILTDPEHWYTEPNVLAMELYVESGKLRLLGSLVRNFIFMRVRYFFRLGLLRRSIFVFVYVSTWSAV